MQFVAVTSVGLLAALGSSAAPSAADTAAGAPTLAGHTVVLDASGRLLSWVRPQEGAYDRVLRLAFEHLLEHVPVESNGLPTYYTYCCFDGATLRGAAWPHNPAAVNAGLALGAAAYYAYAGDERVLGLVGGLLSHHILNGTTPPTWPWGGVPYASSDHGAVLYRGGHDFLYDKEHPGRADGYGVVEPDKLGELGFAYLRFWELTGQPHYREAALACARALARHVRPGDAERSPWPFRVYAETGVVREEYCANLAPALRLFDELLRLGLGERTDFERARQTAYDWLLAYPLRNQAWANYFEDLPWIGKTTNLNQYDALETARFLLETQGGDPVARDRAQSAIEWVERTFGGDWEKEKGVQWGATTISEQTQYMYKMGSHTSRYASVRALWHEKAVDAASKEKAFRSFNWATYMCDEKGVVRVGPVEPSWWFSDGYADYVRHFMAGLGSVPEWAPPGEDHLLRSTSVVTRVSYRPGEVSWRTFDDRAVETLRLSFVPISVTAGGVALPRRGDLAAVGWTCDRATGVLHVRHEGSRDVSVRSAAPPGARARPRP
jgi:hypothetical protein